jgi:hypothetical protein
MARIQHFLSPVSERGLIGQSGPASEQMSYGRLESAWVRHYRRTGPSLVSIPTLIALGIWNGNFCRPVILKAMSCGGIGSYAEQVTSKESGAGLSKLGMRNEPTRERQMLYRSLHPLLVLDLWEHPTQCHLVVQQKRIPTYCNYGLMEVHMPKAPTLI